MKPVYAYYSKSALKFIQGEVRAQELLTMNYDEKSRQELISENIDLLLELAKYKNKHKELEHKVSKLSVAFHSIGDGVIIVNKELTVLLFNPAAEDLTGWTIQKACGRPLGEVFRLIRDKSGETRENPAVKAVESGEAASLDRDTMLVSLDGSRRFISASCAPIFDDRNECYGAVLVFRDISKMRESEDAVIESEKKYRTIIENSQDLIYEVDTTGKALYVNPACRKILGFKQSEIIGKSVFDLIHPEDVPRVLTVFSRALMNMSAEKATYRARNKDGRYLWFEGAGSAFMTKDGEKLGVVITRDITDQKQAELAVAWSEALFRAVFEGAGIGIALVNREGKPIRINPALQSMLGYAEEELGSMAFTEFTHPDDASTDWALFSELIEGKIDHYHMEKKYIHKNGYIVHGLLNVSLITGPEGNEPYVLATVADISERVMREGELAVLNKLMQTVHRFLGLEEVYRVALDTVVSMDIVDMAMIYLIDEDKKEAVLQAYRNLPETYVMKAGRIPYPKGNTWKVIESGSIINIENVKNDMTMGPAGRELGEHSALGIPIFIKDKAIGVLWFFSMKERKFTEKEIRFLTTLGDQIAVAVAKARMMKEIESAQEQLVQSEKMASIGRLMSSIAHEINNPLTPILGYSQRLLERRGIDNHEKESLEIIFNSAQRLVRIIEKLLTFSRESLPVSSYEDINRLIEQTLEFREYQYELENIEIVRKLDPELPETMLDPGQMQQVFMNLLLNAEQAIAESRGSGVIEIETRLKNRSCIEITITDDGPGIPDDIKGKVIDPFFTTREPGKGTGLGLSVSYGIIKKHGGELFIENGEKGGARIVIDLPVVEPHGKLGETDDAASEDRIMEMKNKRVLIVEDEVIMTSLLKTVFEEQGHIADIASSGREAIHNRDLEQYDLIVCDLRLPDINGMELFKQLKKRYPDIADRVFFITGDTSGKTKKFLDKSGNPYLMKPFKIDKFKERVSEVLAR